MSVTGVQQAFSQGIKEGFLRRPFNDTPGFVQLLAGLDGLYARSDQGRMAQGGVMTMPNTRIKVGSDVGGDNIIWGIGGADVTATGVSALTGNVNDLISPLEEAAEDFLAKQGFTYVQSPPIALKDAIIEKVSKNPTDLMEFVKNKSEQVARSFINKINADIFPQVTLVSASAAGSTQASSETQFESFYRALSTGQQHNGTGTSLSYVLNGIEVGTDNTRLRAIQWGTENSGTAFTLRTFRENVLMPLRKRGHNPDIALVNGTAFAWLQNSLEGASLQYGLMETIDFGIQVITIDGVRFMYEPRMDTYANASGTNINQMYIGCSDSLEFRMKALGDHGNDISSGSFQLKEHPQSVSMKIIQAAMIGAYINKYPFKWAQANNITFA